MKKGNPKTLYPAQQNNAASNPSSQVSRTTTPSIDLPKGGGAVKGIEEKFKVNAVNGTSSFSIPLPLTSSRQGVSPAIGLSYNSGNGNGPFGLGWESSIPEISRKTEKQLPLYRDEEESDTFIYSEAEDLVPLLETQGTNLVNYTRQRTENGISYTVNRYIPRVEGLFARIEKWKDNPTGHIHWRTISKNNVHSYYGLTDESRISDPTNSQRIYKWLLCRSHDDKGNITLYAYKKEDYKNIPGTLNEKNRIHNSTQTYIKKVLYGNKTAWYLGDALPSESDFLFKVIFDYGEHDASATIPKDIVDEKADWPCRKDPFSSCRAGFEIRTYRRCQRILLFHCFDAPELPHKPYLVKSLELSYEEDLKLNSNDHAVAGFSFLTKARQNGHIWNEAANHYSSKHLPDFEFSYQQHEWNTEIKSVTEQNIIHAPIGIDDKKYLWIDLFNEGLSGILTEQQDAWYYKSNLGNGKFSHARPVTSKPTIKGLTSGDLSIQEVEANGVKYFVSYEKEPKGFFKMNPEGEWSDFKSFSSFPNINSLDLNARFIDLNGDGRADLLLTEEKTFRWYPGAGEKGFELPQTVTKEIDEEKGPAILFNDQSQSIFLADMNGDGLTDIVRIRNGEICYWPNLGYGRFGAKTTMDHAPLFDHPDSFNPEHLRLADIDGSGTIDIMYLGKNDLRVWMNLNGNAFSEEPQTISTFPGINHLSDVFVIDLLGTGTSSIVYSSSLPQNSGKPLQYIDLMGSKKPGLLISYKNNCGREVSFEYKSSAHYYLEDKQQGLNWITTLPFAVHCLSRIKVEDKIRETIFVSSYRYSHGYYDPDEREFRGFARVEKLDTEDFSSFKINAAKNVVEESLHQPPVKTISWFHTGAFIDQNKILHQCREEYFQNTFFNEYAIPESFIPGQLTAEELREALRACKGLPLRVETYSDDQSAQSAYPYSASESAFEIRMIQPKKENRFAVFTVIPSESISYSYDRNPSDPKIAHSFNLQTNEYGYPEKTASVSYARINRPAAPNDIPDKVWEEQSKVHMVYNESFYTNDIIEDTKNILRTGYESKGFEVAGIAIPAGSFIDKKTIGDLLNTATVISFEEEFTSGVQKRLSGHSRSYFFKDDLSGPLPLGQLSSLGIEHKRYQLAFTKNIVTKYYGTKVTDSMLLDAGYVHSEGDEHWWAPSGINIFSATPKNNFYTPIGFRDVFGNESFTEYDTYALALISTTDALGNKISNIIDYRTLSPVLVTDANQNRGAVETDELGLVIKSAAMGKAGNSEGDTLADPTARMEYDLFNWQNNQKPNYVRSMLREEHGPANTRWKEKYEYTDGAGNVIMTKVQAEPGKAKKWNTVTQQVEETDADPRWTGNGRTIVNNKGNVVKLYEPYFSNTHEYEQEDALVETGITSVIYYDALGRTIRIEYPNGTFSKTEFDAWKLVAFDVNDTCKDSQWYIDRGSPDPASPVEPSDPDQRAAWLSAKHYNTPGIVHNNASGRTIYAATRYENNQTIDSYSETDLFGRYIKIYDELGRKVSEGYKSIGGSSMYGKNAEKGESWVLMDVMGRLVKMWDNTTFEFRSTFDKLHRPVSSFVKEGGTEILFAHVVYGDLLPNAEALNMKGKVFQVYDQAGVVTMKNVDFKGNITAAERKLAKEYKQYVNWNSLAGLTDVSLIESTAAPLLENEPFSSSSAVDALNRPTTVVHPDKSVVKPTYNIAGTLESLDVQIRGAGNFINFLESQDYDAKGQRLFAKYGNGLITHCSYDPENFRLINSITKKQGTADSQSHQNLHYTYDPIGNIIYSRDDAQETFFFNNAVVKAESKFEFNALYQLKKATGREHSSLTGNAQRNHTDLPFLPQLPHENDASAVRIYTEQYEYDKCGNILELNHIASGASWNQFYRYEYEDDASNVTNRLKATSLPGDPASGPYSSPYEYDFHGNMKKMSHLSELHYSFTDRLMHVNLGGGGNAHYVYGMGGGRIRKVIERIGGKKTERIYLGAVEIYREYQGTVKKLERSTLHVADNSGKIVQVDTKVLDTDNADSMNLLNQHNIRYQYSNHLGSSVLETDENGNVISYEEYHPYGSSSYRSSKSGVDMSLKRYRFCGKERDDETGLYYVGTRYYACWLGRWTSSDPAGFADGLNLFRYCRNNPVMLNDPSGMAPPSSHTFAIPEEHQSHLSNQSPESGRILEQDIEGRTWEIEGHTYRFHGHIDPEGEGWFYTWNRWEEINPGTGEVIASGTNPGATPGEGLHDSSAGAGAGGEGGEGGGGIADSGGTANLPARPLVQPGIVSPDSLPPTRPIPKVDLPQAPPGTDFRAAEAAGRLRARATYTFQTGEQAQHYLKWRNGRDCNLDPRITNDPRYMGPLQSRNALSPQTYTINGRTFGNPHTYADRGLYPHHEAEARAQLGGVATERVIHVEAGRRTQQSMTGSRGPTPPYIWRPTAIGAGGHLALGATRTLVPFVAEAEIGFATGSMYAYAYGYTAVGSGLATAAAYTPIVAGSAVAGALAGNVADSAVTSWTGSSEAGVAAGVIAAAGTGAAVGALIGSVVPIAGTAVGAGAGAIVGAVAGLGAYLITRFW